MNKKLTIHLIALFLYIVAVLFVLGGNEPDTADRFLIVMLLLFSQGFTAAITGDS